jgi:hypothetical protein
MKFKDITLADVSVETKIETLGIALDSKLETLESSVTSVEKQIGPQGEKGDKGDKGDAGIGRDGRDGTDGAPGRDGIDGVNGVDGNDGTGVADVEVDLDGRLLVTLTDGTVRKSIKEIVGPQGPRGIPGADGGSGSGSAGVSSFNTRTGAVSLTSVDVTTALTFTPYDSTNPSGYTSNVGTVTSVTGNGVLSVATGTTTPAISISQATTTTSGYLSNTDWNTFNSKQASGTYATGSGTASGTNTGDETTATIKTKLGVATTSTDGYLTSANWTTFNNKANSGANTDITSVVLTTGTISTAPSSSTDIVNKSYADSIASGVNFHAACNYATTTALSTNTYNNGASGIGATLTAAVSGALSIDGSTPAVGNRILVKNEVTQANNGVYIVTQVGSGVLPYILTRATDYDSSGSGTNEVDQGDLLLVLSGTTNSNTSWVQQTPLPITIGTTAIVFIQFAAIQTYTAGTGLTLTTNQFSIAAAGTAGTYGSATLIPVITTNAQGQVTSVTTAANPQGTVTSVAALTLGTTGTDLSSTVATGTTTPVITLQVPTASATNRGALSAADWTTFNNKGSGTVTSVGGTGTVNGLTLTGTVTSSGNLTLGGTLDLSSPPAIGSTAANTGSFTSLACTSVTDTGSLARNAGRTANTTITNQATFTTGGLTLASQTAAAGSTWRIRAFGQFTAASSATARTAQVACFWGTTQLTAITPSVLISGAQTTQWQCEFTLTASSTTAMWTAGTIIGRTASATALAIDNATPASTTVTAGAQTLDLRFRASTAVAAEGWVVQSVTMERLK